MSCFQTAIQTDREWKKVLLVTSVTFLLLSPAVCQQKSVDKGGKSTKSEQYTHIVYCADRWFSQDKIYHFMAGFLGTTAISGALNASLDTPRKDSAIMASPAIFSIGLLKEAYDRKQWNNHFCWKDLTANVLGIVLGACFWLSITGDEMGKI
ncbi:MAG: hypothetical protein CMG71_04600 [Candidatus Marinimicrobia bacterium]|nr:hypothetical protein [Candidatus Neomarinimicrobiota bacterium]|tara:strand:+ start:8175 stop:8630 length:456 start_codon:yes stop_codon:yes gene_type:complete